MHGGLFVETLPLWINGKPYTPQSAEYVDVVNPATGELIARQVDANESDISAAVSAAQRALDSWASKLPGERARILFACASALRDNIEDLARIESVNTGRPIREMRAQMRRVPEFFEYYAGVALTLAGGDSLVVPGTFQGGYQRIPLGVVGLLAPFNHPLMITAKKLSAALSAGNTAILKPSEYTPLSAFRLAELFQQAGLPSGALNVVTGQGSTTGKLLVGHRAIRKIDVTGSEATGRAIAQQAGYNLKRVTCELGGKGAAIFFDDCNLDDAVSNALYAVFIGSGQTCIQAARLLVQRSLYPAFVNQFANRVRALRVGDPMNPTTQLGPVISERQRQRILGMISEAVQSGARLIAGGKSIQGQGFFLEPTVFVDVDPGSRLGQEEVFGPVVSIMPFDDWTDAVKIANDTRYGLGMSVWTSDLKRALQTRDALDCGIVWVNDHHRTEPSLPWNGFKASGLGTECGIDGYLSYTLTQTTILNYSGERFGWFDSTDQPLRLN